MVTRKVLMAGEVISDAESEKFPGFFAYITEDGQRTYASYSDWSVTQALQPGQRVEFVTVTYSWFWGKIRRTKSYAQPGASEAGHIA